MSDERLEQVEQKLDSLINAIQTGFGSFERQLNDIRGDNRQLSSQLNDIRGDNRQLSDVLPQSRGVRLTYDDGMLDITVPLKLHEFSTDCC
jgi:septal ring factor EnvC (AmiA/AmiB activator)